MIKLSKALLIAVCLCFSLGFECEAAKSEMNQLDYLLVTCDYIKATNGMGTGYAYPGKVDSVMARILKEYGYEPSAYPRCESSMGGLMIMSYPQDVLEAKTKMALQYSFGGLNCEDYRKKYAQLADRTCGQKSSEHSLQVNYTIENPEHVIELKVKKISAQRSGQNVLGQAYLEITNNKALFYKVYIRHFNGGEYYEILDPKGKYSFNENFIVPLGMSQSVSYTVMYDDSVKWANAFNTVWHALVGEYVNKELFNAIIDANRREEVTFDSVHMLSDINSYMETFYVAKGISKRKQKFLKWPNIKDKGTFLDISVTIFETIKSAQDGRLEWKDYIDFSVAVLQTIVSNKQIRNRIIYRVDKALGKSAGQKLGRQFVKIATYADLFAKIPGQAGIAYDSMTKNLGTNVTLTISTR